MDQLTSSSHEPPEHGLQRWGFRILLLVALLVIIIIGVAGIVIQDFAQPTPIDPTLSALATSLLDTATPSLKPSETLREATSILAPVIESIQGTFYYSASSGGQSHIYAYAVGDVDPVQLTFGEWDDRDPAVHPEGTSIAYASNRDGFWDLYLEDLNSGDVQRLTETQGYIGHPTWSPDGRWIAYEAYEGDNFDVWILPLDPGQPVFQLTNHPGNDVSPTWDPNGRRIAFVSDRTGRPDIFLAHLDRPDDRFVNLTNSAEMSELDPAFNSDGSQVAFTLDGPPFRRLGVLRIDDDVALPMELGQGETPTWSPDDGWVVGKLNSVNDAHIVTYTMKNGTAQEIGLPIHGNAQGMTWVSTSFPAGFLSRHGDRGSPTPPYVIETSESPGTVERLRLVTLAGITAPNAMLADTVDEAFMALRERIGIELGWDFLGKLENAFVGINDPLPPSTPYNDWLYTGRAFAFHRDSVNAGWIEFVKEEFGGETYWRVFVRTVKQDGSQGEPLRTQPWDFTARFDGDPEAYDRGGRMKSDIPDGYYLDFSELALDFGFERVSALSNWRTYYEGARYNEFVYRAGLDWLDAMLELYPPSAIVTPTAFMTPTPTPTRTPRPTPTPWWWRWQTPVSPP